MPPRTRKSSLELGALIRSRRQELGLSIEHAALSAGMGSETWRRYEAGNAMRTDKVQALVKVLRWRKLPAIDQTDHGNSEPKVRMWDLAPDSDAYSRWLATDLGEACARVFAVGCDIWRDQVKEDVSSLAAMPRGTHIGELPGSWLEGYLPDRWLVRYEYEFAYRLHATLEGLAQRALHPGFDGIPHFTRCVADDLALHLVMDMGMVAFDEDQRVREGDVAEWEYELNGEDDEVVPALFSKTIHPESHEPWHFDNWFDERYYQIEEGEAPVDGEPFGGREAAE